MIWHRDPSLDDVNALAAQGLSGMLGIRFTEVGADFLRATMPVTPDHHQPLGLLHGGASVALAETIGSVAGFLILDPEKAFCVGLEINANHVRAVRDGHVTATARPLHIGRTTQVWDIRIEDDAQRLVCVSRITLAVQLRG